MSIKWTRAEAGRYFSGCNRYSVQRRVKGELTDLWVAYSHTYQGDSEKVYIIGEGRTKRNTQEIAWDDAQRRSRRDV